MRRKLHWDEVARLTARALASGGVRKSMGLVEWKISGNCTDPHLTELFARPSRGQASKMVTIQGGVTRTPLRLELSTRCRKCDACRKTRSTLWIARSRIELERSARTWFGTLTLSPNNQSYMLAKARHKAAGQAVDYDALPYGEQFLLLDRAISVEITKMWKRIRKNTKAPFIYLLVAEAHKSGLPHYHCLLHEQDLLQPVRHAQLEREWRLGFSKWKLVTDLRSGAYVCKYLSKSSAARVRASLDYGKERPIDIVAH